ncbi:hypothetical protein ACWDFR_44690, partial [Streptomyces sp. 900105755]
MTGPGTDRVIRLRRNLQPFGRTRPELLPDEHSTIGNHFEVAKSPTVLADRVEAELTVSRTLRMESVLVAGHRELTGARADRFRAAAETAEEMRNSSPLQVRIQGDGFAVGVLGDQRPGVPGRWSLRVADRHPAGRR